MVQKTPILSHWNKHARQWGYVKAPLRPCAEDIGLIQQVLDRHFTGRASLDGLLLGVTPELASNDWVPALKLVAVDSSQAMIDGVWPGDDGRRKAICGNWLQLPLLDHSMDLALIDGGLPAITFPEAHRALATQLHRVLKSGGLFIARIFARPEHTESVRDVLGDLQERRIGNFQVFKWRLAMALQGPDAGKGIRVDEVWRTYDRHFGRHTRLEQLTGWPIEEIRTIDAYRGSQAIYHFPSVAEMMRALEDGLVCIEKMHATYELADRCPTLVFGRSTTR